VWALVVHAEKHLSEEQRVELCCEFGRRVGVDYDQLASARSLSMLTPDEIRSLSDAGVDIQMHTHRHIMPADRTGLRREIEDNRAVLEAATGRRCEHLCYPSGVFSAVHWQTLRDLGIRSASTCEAGLNEPHGNTMRLARILDAENLTDIEVEAALSGFLELQRRLKEVFVRRKTEQASIGVKTGPYGH
jgi:hypothetical protein